MRENVLSFPWSHKRILLGQNFSEPLYFCTDLLVFLFPASGRNMTQTVHDAKGSCTAASVPIRREESPNIPSGGAWYVHVRPAPPCRWQLSILRAIRNPQWQCCREATSRFRNLVWACKGDTCMKNKLHKTSLVRHLSDKAHPARNERVLWLRFQAFSHLDFYQPKRTKLAILNHSLQHTTWTWTCTAFDFWKRYHIVGITINALLHCERQCCS